MKRGMGKQNHMFLSIFIIFFIGSGDSTALNIHKYSLRTCKANETCRLICFWPRFFLHPPKMRPQNDSEKKNPECSQFVRSSLRLHMYTSVHPIAQELGHWKMASWFGTHFSVYDGAIETNFMKQKD